MKLYTVQISLMAVVAAEDAISAYFVADAHKRDIFNDDPDPRIEVDGEIKKAEDLRDGWDVGCLPYGGDGSTRIGELLKGRHE